MTVVLASIDKNLNAFIMGDVLLSRQKLYEEDDSTEVPSDFLKQNSFSHETLIISGLARKVYIIHPHLAMAWSGSKDACRRYLNFMKEEFESIDDISHEILEEKDKKFKNEWQKLLQIREGDINIVALLFDNKTGFIWCLNSGPYSKELQTSKAHYCIAGSGFHYVADALRREREDAVISSANAPPHFEGLSQGLTLASKLLNDEIVRNECLHDFYGGFYEVAVFDPSEERFKLLRSVDYLFFEVMDTLDKKRTFFWEPYVYRMTHEEDNSLSFEAYFSGYAPENCKTLPNGDSAYDVQYKKYTAEALIQDKACRFLIDENWHVENFDIKEVLHGTIGGYAFAVCTGDDKPVSAICTEDNLYEVSISQQLLSHANGTMHRLMDKRMEIHSSFILNGSFY